MSYTPLKWAICSIVGLIFWGVLFRAAQAFGPRLIIIGLLGLASGVWVMWAIESTRNNRD